MKQTSNHFNTTHLLPAVGYHNQLMREIDDAYWLGDDDDAKSLQLTADDVHKCIDKGDVWYPLF